MNDARAFRGYSLIAPMKSTTTYLVDMNGRVVHAWRSSCTPALSAYLLKNGHLLRPGAQPGADGAGFGGPGSGGRIQEFSWDGKLLWDFSLSTERNHPHHDICPMPNGNVLVIAWDKKTAAEAIAAGRHSKTVQGELLPDCILEIHPTGKTTGEIVWQWHAWDHLIQEWDKAKANYGNVSEHPELINVNFGTGFMASLLDDLGSLAKLRSLGYVGAGGAPAQRGSAPTGGGGDSGNGQGGQAGQFGGSDLMHTNSVDYNAALDQIMLSVHEFSEVWIIDHGTTTAQAAAHCGGRSGKGGDLLYRWGNPRAYRNGSNADQRLFAQHCAKWIPRGLPGEGHMLAFNNGGERSDGIYSTVDEVVLPVDDNGRYAREEYAAFGPERATWSYAAPERSSFYAMNISGAQRLPNGDTFICSGVEGVLFEVTANKDIVWDFSMAHGMVSRGGMLGGRWMFGFGGMPGPHRFGPAGSGQSDRTSPKAPPTAVGFNMSDQKRLSGGRGKPQDGIDGGPASGGSGGGAPAVPARGSRIDGIGGAAGVLARGSRIGGGYGGRGFGGPDGLRGRGGYGGAGGIFTCYRYAVDYAGLAGKDLTPGRKLEELIAQ